MSRVGKKPVAVPPGVEVTLEGQRVLVSGPQGELEHDVHPSIRVFREDGEVRVERPGDQPEYRALHGLTRALIQNMVVGVTQGYRRTLEITGTGYRAQLRGESLVLSVGFSHAVELAPLPGVSFELETPTRIHVSGIDKQKVGQQAALIRRVRPPEPYRGKGIRYRGEVVRLRAGKAKK
ncbi:MAG: 50S ribosomal protein L6 [Chloroflexi bacterium]|nr:50S ribosomal protein L6 [Chloroflexota bacterium]